MKNSMKNGDTLGQKITVAPSTDEKEAFSRLRELEKVSKAKYFAVLATILTMSKENGDEDALALMAQLEAAPRYKLLQTVKCLQDIRCDFNSDYIDQTISLIHRLL